MLTALAGSQLRDIGVGLKGSQHIIQEIAIPKNIIGCVIGKGGSKIAEIR